MTVLENNIRLTFPVMSVFRYDYWIAIPKYAQTINNANLYAIVKRPVAYFSKYSILESGKILSLSIKLDGIEDFEVEILIPAEGNSEVWRDGFIDVRDDPCFLNNKDKRVCIWIIVRSGEEEESYSLSVDELLYSIYNGLFPAALRNAEQTDLSVFVTYEVLYVGECVEETLTKRFSAHHALLDILKKERVISDTFDKNDEILIMPMIVDSYASSMLSGDSTEADIEELMGDYSFSSKTISLDCEKALVQNMQPKYNKITFKNYPISKDGLYNHNLKGIVYRLDDFVILSYGDGKLIKGPIMGDITLASTIVVSDKCMVVYDSLPNIITEFGITF